MKKALLTIVMCVVMCCMLAFAVSAATPVTDDGTNLTLGDCTIDGLDGVTIPSPTTGLAYSLDDETMSATVTGKGSFAGGDGVNLVFPSSVTYEGKTYVLTTINKQTFQGMTYNLYVPDSVTFIGGGVGTGAFGNSVISKIYIGCGLTSMERELFSGSKDFTVFVCKSKPTSIDAYAFHQNSAASTGLVELELDLTRVVRIETLAFSGASFLSGQSIELGDCIEYIGEQAFVNSKVSGRIVIPENCTLSYRCFNGTSFERVVIEVPEGQTRALPTELFSGASAGLTVVINGDATVSANYVFSGNAMNVYMETKEQLQTLISGAAACSGNDRIEKVTFYSCDGLSYTSTRNGVMSEGSTAMSHIYTDETASISANCTFYAREAYICYACGSEKIVSQGTELGEHVFDISTKVANCQSIGYTEYDCTVCGLQEVGVFVDKTAHNNSVKAYTLNDDRTVTVKTSCEYCGTLGSIENVSLLNKCYIEGYGLFDATLEYVSVSADGTLTPSGVTFDNAVIYFPSYVEVNGSVVEVKTIQGFKGKSIKSIYIPDTVTRIVGGSGKGCFGDVCTIKNIVVGKGVTEIEQELFCMGTVTYVDEFIFKATIKKIHKLAFQQFNSSSSDIPYEFNTMLEYVGKQVNINGNILREAYIAKGCDLTEKYAFNQCTGLTTVYIEGGDSAETALDLGQEFTSNKVTQYYYIKGYVTVSGQAVLSEKQNIRIFMENTEAIDLFANAIKSNSWADRIDKATFMECLTDAAWFVSSSADRVAHPSVAYSHGGIFEITESTCTQVGKTIEKCFVCGETISESEVPVLDHEYDGGVIARMPDCNSLGAIIYSCFGCGESNEFTIFRDYSTHNYIAFMTYASGFDKNGKAGEGCTICLDTRNESDLAPILTALGYSVRDEAGARNGIDGGYVINSELLERYEQINGQVRLGIIIANAEEAAQTGLVGSDFCVLGSKAIQAELSSRGYSSFNLSIVGFDNDELKALDLLITAYVVADLDGDGATEISYVQYTMPDKDNAPTTFGSTILNTVSIDRACPVTATVVAYTGKEEE